MPSFVNVVSGAVVQSQDIQQIIDALKGTAALGIPASLTSVNDSVNFALAVKNTETTNSRALQVLRANNLVMIQADANGVVVSPDGVAAAAQVVNLSLAQTLTNKTLTAPHFTTPVVDSGGLTITAGGLVVSAGGSQITGTTGQSYFTNGAAGNQITLGLRAGGNLGTDVTTLQLQNQAGTATYSLQADALGNTVAIKAGGVAGTILFSLSSAGVPTLPLLPAFVASDRYVTIDSSGNLHKSAIGPAS